MKFFKNKEKQRFSLRKNKAYGLASALLGITVVGTMIATDSLPNSLSAKAWDFINFNPSNIPPTLDHIPTTPHYSPPNYSNSSNGSGSSLDNLVTYKSVPVYLDGKYWKDSTIKKEGSRWVYVTYPSDDYIVQSVSDSAVYLVSKSSGSSSSGYGSSSSSGYGSSSSSDYNSGSSSNSTYGNIHDQPSGPKYIVDDKLNYGESNYDNATGVWHVGTTPTTRTEEIPSTTKKYVKDGSRARGSQPIENPGTPGRKEIKTTYNLNQDTGEVTVANVTETRVAEPTPTIVNVAAADKVETFKRGRENIEKRTVYTVNETSGDVTESSTERVVSVDDFKEDNTLTAGQKRTNSDGSVSVGTKPKVEESLIEFTTSYEANDKAVRDTKTDKVVGKKGKTIKTTTYTLNKKTGDVTPNAPTTNTEPAVNRVVLVGTKPTVVETVIAKKTVYQGDITANYGTTKDAEPGRDGKTITTTTYSLNTQTGATTPNKPTTTTEAAVNKVVKKGTKPKREIVTRNGAKVLQLTNYTVNSETGKVTESITYSLLANDDETMTAEGNTWERRERLTDQAIPIEKITKYTMNPTNGNVTTDVRYEIVGGRGAKKDTLDTTEDVTGKEVPIVKKSHHVLNTQTGKLTTTSTFERKDKGAITWETTERLTDQELPINKITQFTLNPNTGEITKKIRYEIVNGLGAKKDTFDKVEDVSDGGVALIKKTHYILNTETGKLTKNDPVFSRKDGKDSSTETRERLTDQELPIDKITKVMTDARTGKVTKEIRYEIVDGKGDKKDTFDKSETINKDNVEITKDTHYDLNTTTGKLSSTSRFSRKDGLGNTWETSEILRDQELPIKKITKHTLNPDTGEIAKEIHYEIVDGLGDKKDHFNKVENVNSEGVDLIRTTSYTLNTETGKLTKDDSVFSRKSGAKENVWSTVERLTDQELPIDKFTKFTLNPSTGQVTKEIRYEIVNGEGPKKDKFTKIEIVTQEGIELVKTTPFTLNTETGKLTKGESTFSRKDKQDLSGETRERLTDQELPIDKITTTTVDPNTGQMNKRVRYEIVDGLGDKKDHFNKVEDVNKNGIDLVKTTPFTLNTETGKLTKGTPTFARKDGQPLVHEISESVTDKELPIVKYTKTTIDPNTGDVNTEVRYEIANGQGDHKDAFDKVEETESNGVPLLKTTHYTLNKDTGELKKDPAVYSRKDGQENVVETRERLTDQELPIDKITTTTLNPSTGEVTKEVRYEIVDGKGPKKDTFDKSETINKGNVAVTKDTHYTLDTSTGKLQSSSQFSRKDGKGNVWETREQLTDQELPIDKVATHMLNPNTGEITTTVRYEIVDGLGTKKDRFNKKEDVTQNGVELIKNTPYTLNVETGKLTKGTPTFTRKDGKDKVTETVERLTDQELPIDKFTKSTVNAETGTVTKEIRYEIVDGLGDKKDHFTKVENTQSQGIDLVKTTQFILDTDSGHLTKGVTTFTRKDGKDNSIETVERLTDQELPIDRFTKTIVDPTTGRVTKEYRYEIVDGLGEKKDTFDKVEELEEQGIKIKKLSHYTLQDGGKLTKKVTYTLANGENSFDKVETLKRDGQTIEKTTHYELDPQVGKFEITTSEKVLTSNGSDEQGNRITPPIVELPEYTNPIGGSNSDGEGNVIEVLKHEKPEYSGKIDSNGVDESGNTIEPLKQEKPEYKETLGGSNSDGEGNVIEPPVLEKPEYKGTLGGNNTDSNGNVIEPLVVDVPKYKDKIDATDSDSDIKVINPAEMQKSERKNDDQSKDKLPKTGAESLIGVTATGFVAAVGAAVAKLRKKK